MTRSRRWAAPAATAALVAVTGCGGHAGRGNGDDDPAHPASAASPPGTPLSLAPSGDATGSPQPPARGSYDDTGGTGPAPRSQRPVLSHLPGRAGGCVQAGDHNAVRSGKVAMGDFAQARAEYLAVHGAYDAEPSHFYVIPRSRTAGRATVTMSRVGGGAPAIHASADHLEDAAQWRYFPISVKITRPGTWRFTVSVDGSAGCFLASFTR